MLDRFGADALRWYFFTSKQPWDGYRFSLEAVGEGVRLFLKQLWNTYALLVALRERGRRGGRRGAAPASETDLDRWVLLAAGGDGRGGHRAAGRLRRDDRRPRDRGVRRRPLQLVRAPLAPALLGGRPGRLRDAARVPRDRRAAARAVHAVRRRRDLRQPRRRASRRVHLCDWPQRRRRATRSSRSRWRPRARRCALGPRRARAGEGQGPPAAARGGRRRAGREREAIERLADVVREELNVEALRFVDDADELGSLRGQAELPHARPALRQAHAAGRGGRRRARPRARRRGAARGRARSAIAIDGHDHELSADDLLLAMQPLEGYQLEREGSHAVALELALDDELRREGWRARSSTPCRTRARTRASRSRTASR